MITFWALYMYPCMQLWPQGHEKPFKNSIQPVQLISWACSWNQPLTTEDQLHLLAFFIPVSFLASFHTPQEVLTCFHTKSKLNPFPVKVYFPRALRKSGEGKVLQSFRQKVELKAKAPLELHNNGRPLQDTWCCFRGLWGITRGIVLSQFCVGDFLDSAN